jgi:hypothetical protein
VPTLNLHHYKNQNQPYVAKIVADGKGGATQAFLGKTLVRKSADGSYGDYQCDVNEEGFYRIGNTKPEDGGYRLFFHSQTGNKFPFIKPPQIVADIKARIARGETIPQIVSALGLLADA